jgi:hypothetical protein
MKSAAELFVVVMLASSAAFGATVLHYDFEDGTPNTPMNPNPGETNTGLIGSVDLSGNGYDMLAWNDYYGPLFSAEGDTPTGMGLSSAHDRHRDGYCPAAGLVAWSPSTWTIEVSFRLNDLAGWQTLIGKDGWSGIAGDIAAAMYIQCSGENDVMRVNFVTVSNERIILDSSLIPVPGQWYHLAVVADGDWLDMYADQFDSNGFRNIGSLTMTAGVDHSIKPTGTWTFGRGWFNGAFVDHIDGNLDNIRFSDEALTTDQLIPSTLLGTKTQAHDPQPENGAKDVPVVGTVLSWKAGVDPADPNVPNPAITGHNLWLSIPYDPTNPPAAPDWYDPGIRIIELLADVNPADGNVDPMASYSSAGLQRDALYYWIVDESLGAADPRDWDNIIQGSQWSFQTVTSAPEVDAGSSIVTWLEEGTTTVELNGTVTDVAGDVTAILWSVVSSPPGSIVDIADNSVAATTAMLTETGEYVLELRAVDAAQNEDSDQMEINVYGDSCEAAQNNPNGYTAPPYDVNDDCKVDFLDFAMFAAGWLDDASLMEDALYEPD